MFTSQAAGVAQGGGDGRAAGTARENALAASQGARGVKRLGIRDANPVINQLAIERLGHKILADALDFPGMGGAAGKYGTLRIGTDNADVGISLLEVAGHAGDGTTGADAGHEGSHPAFGLFPDLRTGGAIVNFRVGQVGELVGPPGAWDLAGQAVGHTVVTFGRIGRHIGRRDDDLGAIGLE